jgi:hypothetical protein
VTEARKRLIDVTDPRFVLPENADVLAFIARTQVRSPMEMSEACSSAANRIFAIAHGQRKLAFRLVGTPRADAIADGATPADGIAADWIYIEPWPQGVTTASNPARLRRIAELALSQLDTSAGGTE